MKNIASQIRAYQVRDDSLPTTIPNFLSGRFDDPAGLLLSSLHQAPAIPTRTGISGPGTHKRLDETREIVARLRAITLVVVPSVIPYR